VSLFRRDGISRNRLLAFLLVSRFSTLKFYIKYHIVIRSLRFRPWHHFEITRFFGGLAPRAVSLGDVTFASVAPFRPGVEPAATERLSSPDHARCSTISMVRTCPACGATAASPSVQRQTPIIPATLASAVPPELAGASGFDPMNRRKLNRYRSYPGPIAGKPPNFGVPGPLPRRCRTTRRHRDVRRHPRMREVPSLR